jgi:WD40 repeat protein
LKGTFGFIAPELHELVPAGTPFAADMWALGEIAFQLMTKQPVFKSFGLMARYATQNHQYPLETLLTYRISTPGQNFISSLMVATPEMRLTAEAALKHQWIARYLLLDVQPSSSSSSPMTRAPPATDSITEVLASWNSISISDSPLPDLSKTLSPKGNGSYQPVGGSFDPRLAQQEQAGAERTTDAFAKSLVSTRYTLQPEYVSPSTHTSEITATVPAVATASPSSYQKPLPQDPPIDTAVRSTSDPKMPPSREFGRDMPQSASGLQHNHNVRPSASARVDVHGQVTPMKKATYHIGALIGHTEPVHSVVFSPDGATIASGSYDKSIRIWDAGTGKQLQELYGGHTEQVSGMVFSPHGATIASTSQDRSIRIWDAGTGKQLLVFFGHVGTDSLVFSPDGATIAVGSKGSIRILDAGTGKHLQELSGHVGWVGRIVFSPDGAIIASASQDRSIRIWDVGTGNQLRELGGHTGHVYGVAFSPDGVTLASGSRDGSVRIWNAGTGKQLHKLSGLTHEIGSIAFSPHGAIIASASASWGKSVSVWDVGTGKQLREFSKDNSKQELTSIAFSPDGTALASGSKDGSVWILDVGTQ